MDLDRQVGVVVLGEKRYDDGEINRVIVHAEAMQRAIETKEGSEQIGKLQQGLERLQRRREPDISNEHARMLLALCARHGLRFKNETELLDAANDLLEAYYELFTLEKSPFLKCSRVQSRLARSRRDAADILRDEIASTIAATKPPRLGGRDSLRWIYLNRRYIEQYDEKIGRYTVKRIAA